MSIYRCYVLNKIEILREFQSVKNKAYDKRFLNIVILSPPDSAADNGFLLTEARRE